MKQQQTEITTLFTRCQQEVAQQVVVKFQHMKAQYNSLLQTEREHVSTLKASLLNKDITANERVKLINDDQVNSLERDLKQA